METAIALIAATPSLSGHGHPLPLHLIILVFLVAIVVLLVTRRLEMVCLTAIPLLAFFMLRYLPGSGLLIVFVGALAIVIVAGAVFATRSRLFTRSDTTREQVKLWRFLIRPAAMAFPILLFVTGRTFTLILLGAVTAVFLIMDLTRLSAGRINRFLLRRASGTFKTKEQNRLSSMTFFLVSSFLVMLIFTREVALYAMAFMIFGDFAAKFFGLWFGRTKLFNKTLEGTLAHLVTCLSVGAVLAEFVPMPVPVIGLAALVASAVEVLPASIDDNLTVGIFSAAALHFFYLLFS